MELFGVSEVSALAVARSAARGKRRYYVLNGKPICEGCEQELIAHEDEGQR